MKEIGDSEDGYSWVWSKLHTLALIEELKNYPCLYNQLDRNFTNKRKKNEKLNIMLGKLKKINPDVTLAAVKSKLRTLQSQMSRERTKIKKLKESGADSDVVYQSKLWCFKELSGLYPELCASDSKKSSNSNRIKKKVLPHTDIADNSLKIINESDKRIIVDKYILLGTIVHEWTQRCQKYNFSLTNYAIRRKALVLAKIIEIKDFNADSEWISNFKMRFNIKCPIETTEVIVSASTALRTVSIYNVAHNLRIQNKFPERIKKIFDEKFKYKDSNPDDQPLKKKRKFEPNVIDLTETYEKEVENWSTDSDSQIICNIEFQTSKSQDSNNDSNVTTCPLTAANPTASSLIQLNKKFPMKVLSVSAKSISSESVNNYMNLEKNDVVPIQSPEDVASIQSLVKESIISKKTSKESSNKKKLLCGEEDVQNLLTKYAIKLEDIPKSSIPLANEEVVVMDTSENCEDPQLDIKCEETDFITICKDELLEADISEIINLNEKLTGNKFEETIENENHDDVSTNKKFPPIKNYEEALIHLKILEDFALVKCNFRAIHFISNLEDILKKIPET